MDYLPVFFSTLQAPIHFFLPSILFYSIRFDFIPQACLSDTNRNEVPFFQSGANGGMSSSLRTFDQHKAIFPGVVHDQSSTVKTWVIALHTPLFAKVLSIYQCLSN